MNNNTGISKKVFGTFVVVEALVRVIDKFGPDNPNIAMCGTISLAVIALAYLASQWSIDYFGKGKA